MDRLLPAMRPFGLHLKRIPMPACREASADGSIRTLVLSVEDPVEFLEGRKVKHVQVRPRCCRRRALLLLLLRLRRLVSSAGEAS